MGVAIELSREARNECVAKGLAVIQATPTPISPITADDAFDYVILSQTLQATRHPARRTRAHAAAIGGAPSCRFLNFGHWQVAPPVVVRRPYAANPISALQLVRPRPTSTTAPSRISPALLRNRREDGARGGAQCLGFAPYGSTRPGVLEPVREQAVFLLSRKD